MNLFLSLKIYFVLFLVSLINIYVLVVAAILYPTLLKKTPPLVFLVNFAKRLTEHGPAAIAVLLKSNFKVMRKQIESTLVNFLKTATFLPLLREIKSYRN